MNLAPTLLDLAGQNSNSDYVANSIFDETNDYKDPVYLIQPYMGGLQSVIKYPYKVIHEEFTGNDTFYNLKNDLNEIDPISLKEDSIQYKDLMTHVAFIQELQNIFKCGPK